MVAMAALGSATAQLVRASGPEDSARVEAAPLAYAATPAGQVVQLRQSAPGLIGVASTLAFLRVTRRNPHRG